MVRIRARALDGVWRRPAGSREARQEDLDTASGPLDNLQPPGPVRRGDSAEEEEEGLVVKCETGCREPLLWLLGRLLRRASEVAGGAAESESANPRLARITTTRTPLRDGGSIVQPLSGSAVPLVGGARGSSTPALLLELGNRRPAVVIGPPSRQRQQAHFERLLGRGAFCPAAPPPGARFRLRRRGEEREREGSTLFFEVTPLLTAEDEHNFAGSSAAATGNAPLAAAAWSLGECVVCTAALADRVFLPCQHGGLCGVCERRMRLAGMPCHLCRSPVERVLQIEASGAAEVGAVLVQEAI